MPPFFQSIKSFEDVRITDKGVNTVDFLEASDGLINIFDLLGSTAFSTVKLDMEGNVAKVRARYEAAPEKSATLEELVINEPADDKKRSATQGLLWLIRGLSFTCKSLQWAQANKSDKLSASFTNGYEGSLKQFHNFVVKGIFAVAMKACPPRDDFYAKLAYDPNGGSAASQEQLSQDMDKWLAALNLIVVRMEAFYKKGDYGKGL